MTEDINTRTNKTEKLVTSKENKTSGQLLELAKIILTLKTVDRPETNSNAGAHQISERDSSQFQYNIRQDDGDDLWIKMSNSPPWP